MSNIFCNFVGFLSFRGAKGGLLGVRIGRIRRNLISADLTDRTDTKIKMVAREMQQANLYIIAGPNGAGKTTASFGLLPNVLRCPNFVNADEIARGLSPFEPSAVAVQAGRIMLQRIDELLLQHADLAIETTLATRSYVRLVRRAQELGYRVQLLFFYLESEEHAIERVAQRVSNGGHDIPEADIRRRFKRGIYNLLKLYLPICDSTLVFNNTHGEAIFVADHEISEDIVIYRKDMWNELTQLI